MSFSTAPLRNKAALYPVLEKANLTSSRSRPGDIYLPCWSRGRPAALDMTVISSLQSSTLQSAGTSASHALEISDERKFTKHLSACEEAGISFVPLSVEALGGWSLIAAKTIRRMWRLYDQFFRHKLFFFMYGGICQNYFFPVVFWLGLKLK